MSRSPASFPLGCRWSIASLVLLVGLTGAGRSAPLGDAPEPGTPGTAEMESAFNAFFATELDLDHPLVVHDLQLTKDSMVMTLKQGTVYLNRPVFAEVT